MFKQKKGWIGIALLIVVVLAIGVSAGIYFSSSNKTSLPSSIRAIKQDYSSPSTSNQAGSTLKCGDNICYGEQLEMRPNESITFLGKKVTFLGPFQEQIGLYSIRGGLQFKVGNTIEAIDYDHRMYVDGIPIMAMGGGPDKYTIAFGESIFSCFEDCKTFPGQRGEIVDCVEHTGKQGAICVDFAHACTDSYRKGMNYTAFELTEGRACIGIYPEGNLIGGACCLPK